MLRRFVCVLLAAALFLLPGCQQEPEFGGLLANDEVIQYELLYGKSIEEFREARDIEAKDLESLHEGTRWRLHWKRKICGAAFSQIYLAAGQGERGLYGVRFELRMKDGAEAEALALTLALYENALAAYGEPTTPADAEGRIADNLETLKKGKLLDQNFQEKWDVGVNSEFEIQSMVDVENAVIFLRYQSKDAPQEAIED